MGGAERRLLAAAVAVAIAGSAALVFEDGVGDVGATSGGTAAVAAPDLVDVDRPPAKEPEAPSSTGPPETAPPSTEPPATTTTATAPPPPPPPPPIDTRKFTHDPYHGLGVWLDVYDWSATYTRSQHPPAGLADIDRMASFGVRTIYIQAAKWDGPVGVLEPELLVPMIDRAHALGMNVVGWYLPTLTDPAADLARLLAIAALDIEGLGVDIEARDVGDVNERNARLVQLSADLRAALPNEVLSAIVLPPVVMEDVNPNYWPGFPWLALKPYYDVWQPMGYWTNRRGDSGWRDGYRYTAANIDRIRQHIEWHDAPVHPIGGIGDATTPEQVAGMVQASMERGVTGGSIYDYRTTHDALWPVLQAFNG